MKPLAIDKIHTGDARKLMNRLEPESIALSVWSPPYFVGKDYEKNLTYESWQGLLRDVIAAHQQALKPGGFLVINIADILVFPDSSLPRIQAENVSRRKQAVTREDVLKAIKKHPDYNRDQLAEFLGCSEQTIDRRLNGNNIRGGKYNTQTRVKLVGGMIEEMAYDAGLYLYDRRVWVKDPAWENSKWASLSYRAVDEFEHLFFFWKPGITVVDRKRIDKSEWAEWGSRAVWRFPSVRANDIHEAMFPVELPRRCIRLVTDPGETVLDCFMGSGTTAVAAIETGRHFIGVELFSEAVAVANEKIRLARDAVESFPASAGQLL